MSRQVDVKSLVSHIVRGDGLDKCRICMGDTSQGQVHLSDTVMMDGDKAVTLSELLDLITGVQMDDTPSPSLPQQICNHCVSHVTEFLPFLKLCKESAARWNSIAERLVHAIHPHDKTTAAYVIVVGDHITTVQHTDKTKHNNMRNVTMRINNLLTRQRNKFATNGKPAPAPTDTRRVRGLRRLCKSQLYTCPECGSKYKQMSKINQHLANQNKKLCRHCYKIVNLKSFGEHLQTHRIPCYKCAVCRLAFESQEQVVKHERCHIARRRGARSTCAACQRTFPTADTLTLHVHRRHEPDWCRSCDRKFTNRVCLYKHRRECGCGDRASRRYICDHCSKVFKDRSAIKLHISLIHSRRLMHQCEKCGKQFNSACHLEEHYETHEYKPDRYACKYCSNRYSTCGGFRKHVRSKHYSVDPQLKTADRYPCQPCNRNFISQKMLTKHLKAKKHKAQGDKNESLKNSSVELEYFDNCDVEIEIEAN